MNVSVCVCVRERERERERERRERGRERKIRACVHPSAAFGPQSTQWTLVSIAHHHH